MLVELNKALELKKHLLLFISILRKLTGSSLKLCLLHEFLLHQTTNKCRYDDKHQQVIEVTHNNKIEVLKH